MKLHHATAPFALAVLAVFAAPLAHAQGGPWSVGIGAGRSATTIDDPGIRNGIAGEGLGTASIDDKNRATGYKLFGGYQFSPWLGMEAGYFDLGRFGYVAHTLPSGTLNGDIRIKGLNLDLVGTLPLTGGLSAIGRVGVTSIRSRDHFSAVALARVPYADPNPSERSTNWKAGLGLAYAVTDALQLRAEVERYRLRDAVGNTGHADLFSVGLVYRFGASPAPMRAAAPAPMPVYVAPPPPPPPPAPPPVYVPPPPPPPPVYTPAPAPRPAKEGRN